MTAPRATEREVRASSVPIDGEALPDEVRVSIAGTTVVLGLSPDEAEQFALMLTRLAVGARRLGQEARDKAAAG